MHRFANNTDIIFYQEFFLVRKLPCVCRESGSAQSIAPTNPVLSSPGAFSNPCLGGNPSLARRNTVVVHRDPFYFVKDLLFCHRLGTMKDSSTSLGMTRRGLLRHFV